MLDSTKPFGWICFFYFYLTLSILSLRVHLKERVASVIIIVSYQVLSWGSTAALNCFIPQKSVSRMTRGRSKKRHWSSKKSTDENGHSQTGQGKEITTPPPPQQRTITRKGRQEELTEINPSNSHLTEPEIGNDYYYAASKCPSSRYRSTFVLHWPCCQTTT